jgi:hypothetical protein
VAPTKFDQIDRLMRARLAREGELKAAQAQAERANFRVKSLDEAVKELDKTIKELLGESADAQVPDKATPVLQRQQASADDRTVAERIIAYLEASRCPVDALEIQQAIGETSVEVIRATLSKMKFKGEIDRGRKPGTYVLPSTRTDGQKKKEGGN